MPGASALLFWAEPSSILRHRGALLGIDTATMHACPPEPYAQLTARTVREHHAAVWGCRDWPTGPTGNRYGDAAGHSCIAVAGPVERAPTIETGSTDRQANMRAFAVAALEAFLNTLHKTA